MRESPKRAGAGPYREPAPRARPPRPALIPLALVALACAGLVTFTSHKLYRMAQLRGEIAGAESRIMTFEGLKRAYDTRSGRFLLRDTVTGEEREIQLRMTQADRYRISEAISVRCMPNASECFVRDSIYIDDGNRDFDIGLLVIELIGLAASVRAIVKRVGAWRAAVRGSVL